MAFTSTLLPTGEIVHKIFGLPVPLFADSSLKPLKRSSISEGN